MFAAKKASGPKSNKKLPYKIFEDTVLTLIIMSSVLLAIDNPLYDPKSKLVQVIGYIDIAFTCLFFIEASIKVIAKGCFYNSLGPI